MPDFKGATASERLRKRRVDEAHAKSAVAHDLGGGRVLGRLQPEHADAAGMLQDRAAPEHGLALRKSQSDRVGSILPAALVRVEERTLDGGPGTPWSSS